MVRQVITDVIWNELEATLRKYGCHRWKNDRNIMEAILWKLRTGAPWRDVPQEFCPWKTAYKGYFYCLRGWIKRISRGNKRSIPKNEDSAMHCTSDSSYPYATYRIRT